MLTTGRGTLAQQLAKVAISAPLMYHARVMRKTLHLYIFKEIATPFLLGVALFTSVMLAGKFIKLADMVIAKGVPVADVLRLVLYMLPSFSFITIPMALLLAILLAFSRLSADNEITALKASGISLYRLLPPVAAFALLAYLATATVTTYALPWGNASFRSLLYDVINARVNISLKERVFNDDLPDLVIYVAKHDEATHRVSGVLIYDDRNAEEPLTIFARNGMILSDPEKKTIRLRLLDGGVHSNQGTSSYQLMEFASYDLNLDLSQVEKASPSANKGDMTFNELRTAMQQSGVPLKTMRGYHLEFHRRLAFPFACFIFALLAMPLGLHNSRSGKSSGFSLCIAIMLIYYILLSTGKALSQNGILSPAVSMWLPNLLFLAAGLYLFRMANAEQTIALFDLPYRIQTWTVKQVNGWGKRP
jgi:lipopolysaccharide export system permease protein